jgi:hypothetical protein
MNSQKCSKCGIDRQGWTYVSSEESVCRIGKYGQHLRLYRLDQDPESDLIGWLRHSNDTLVQCQNCIDYLYDLERGVSPSNPSEKKPKRFEKKKQFSGKPKVEKVFSLTIWNVDHYKEDPEEMLTAKSFSQLVAKYKEYLEDWDVKITDDILNEENIKNSEWPKLDSVYRIFYKESTL